MFRVGLVLSLGLAVLAGPAFCCCTPRRVADPTGERQAAPAGARPCCSHQAPSAPCDTTRPVSERDDGQRPPCPCKQQGDSLVLPVPSDGDGSDLVKQTQPLPSALDGAILGEDGVSHLSGDGSSPDRGPCAGRFLTSHDLLHTLQRLRC